jgi:hypothetical protein
MSFGIHESKSHGTTIATVIQPWAVNQVWLRERNKLSGSKEVSTFHCTSGWEWPTRSTLALVLNWSNCTLCNPVDFVSKVRLIENFNLRFDICFHFLETKHLLVLLSSFISEHVETNGRCNILLGIMEFH